MDAPVTQLLGKVEVEGSQSQASHGQKLKTLPKKITKAKEGCRAWLK
jgi:hypothetical protein